MSEPKHFRNELERALYGKRGDIDAYLEVADEETIRHDVLTLIESGKSLRDEFAMAADVPWIAAIETLAIKREVISPQFTVAEVVEQRVAMKYCEADAMLAHRSQPTHGGEK